MTLASGQVVTVQLAERGTSMSNGLWVREIRKMTQRAHQAIRLLCEELNQTETVFPRTDLRMVFEVGHCVDT